jgi:hypothetical protein
MRYMLIILGDESQWATLSDEERAANGAAWADCTQALIEAGKFVSGEGLQSVTTATTLRVENGERVLTDGPFAVTKEQIGGFYVIVCKDLDEALDWAAKLPHAEGGTTEIRPVMEYVDPRLAELHDQAAQGAAS